MKMIVFHSIVVSLHSSIITRYLTLDSWYLRSPGRSVECISLHGSVDRRQDKSSRDRENKREIERALRDAIAIFLLVGVLDEQKKDVEKERKK
jgi:hypothetical protein